MKLALSIGSLLLVVVLPASLFPSTAAPARTEECTNTCEPQLSLDDSQTIQGTCATITIVPGAATAGTAYPSCATCSVCQMGATLIWDCNSSCHCTYIWENQSYDRNGNAKPLQSGTGTGSGSVIQTLTTRCNAEQAVFGASVGGTKKVWKLKCTCVAQ